MKLLTVGCFMAILACGACFLPPPRTAPPPLAPDLRASRRLCVQVANLSPSQHIDSRRLEAMFVMNINKTLDGMRLKAQKDVPPQQGDAVLHVSILEESAAAASGQSSFTFSITFNASLTASDGVVVWHCSRRTFTSRLTHAYSESDPWRDYSVYAIDLPFIESVVKEMLSTH